MSLVIVAFRGAKEMPGYSGTPLPKKLGIKDGFHFVLIDAPSDVISELKPSLHKCTKGDGEKDPLDFVMLFAKSSAFLKKEFGKASKNLSDAGMIWVSWPKKTSGVVTDLNENIVRETGLAAGLVDAKYAQ